MNRIRLYAAIGLVVGILGIVVSLLVVTPTFVASNLSPDGILEQDTVNKINNIQLFGLIFSGLLLSVCMMAYAVPSSLLRGGLRVRSSLRRHPRWVKYGTCTLLLALAATLWLLEYDKSYFQNPDVHDYAHMGREIREGHGFSTLRLFPRHIPFLAETGNLEQEHWPNLYRYPLPTVSNAFAQLFFDDVVKASIVQSGVWFLLSAALLFLLSYNLTNMMTALAGTIFFISDPLAFPNSFTGFSESLASFLLLCTLLAAFARTPTGWKWFMAGLFSGLTFLARTQLIFLVPCVIIYIWYAAKKENRHVAVASSIVGTCLALGPWLIRNTVITGNPLFSFSTTRNLVKKALPIDIENTIDAPVQTFAVLQEYFPDILSNIVFNIYDELITAGFWTSIIQLSFPLLFLFVVALCRYYRDNRSMQHFKWATLIVLMVNFLFVSLGFHIPRFYIMLHPLIILVGTYELVNLVRRLGSLYGNSWSYALYSLIILIGVLQVGYHSVLTHQPHRPAIQEARSATFDKISRITNDSDVILSDNSAEISLYSERKTISPPVDPTEILEIDNRYLRIDYVILSRKLLSNEWLPKEKKDKLGIMSYSNFIYTSKFRSIYESRVILPDGSILYRHR